MYRDLTHWTVVLRQNLTEFLECVRLGTRLSQTFSLLADSVDNGTHFFIAALLLVCLCPRPDLTCVFLGTPDPRPDLPGVLVRPPYLQVRSRS